MSRPAGGHVGRDQQVGLLRAEQPHDAVALPLQHAAVQRLAAVAVRVERLDERLDFHPRAAEHERGDRILHVEDAGERRRLVRAVDDVGDLPDARHLAGGRLLARDRDARRVLQVTSGNRQDPRRHRRREERRLPRLGRRLEDRVEVVGEAHVEHLVGLVEDEHLQRVELERLAPHVIERAARRGDDDVGAALERADLLVHRRAAVERQHRAARRPCAYLWIASATCIASSRVGTSTRPHGLARARRVPRRCAAASAARTRPSCPCRSRPGRAGRGPSAAAESFRAEPASVLRSRAPPRHRRARAAVRERRRSAAGEWSSVDHDTD